MNIWRKHEKPAYEARLRHNIVYNMLIKFKWMLCHEYQNLKIIKILNRI